AGSLPVPDVPIFPGGIRRNSPGSPPQRSVPVSEPLPSGPPHPLGSVCPAASVFQYCLWECKPVEPDWRGSSSREVPDESPPRTLPHRQVSLRVSPWLPHPPRRLYRTCLPASMLFPHPSGRSDHTTRRTETSAHAWPFD